MSKHAIASSTTSAISKMVLFHLLFLHPIYNHFFINVIPFWCDKEKDGFIKDILIYYV